MTLVDLRPGIYHHRVDAGGRAAAGFRRGCDEN